MEYHCCSFIGFSAGMTYLTRSAAVIIYHFNHSVQFGLIDVQDSLYCLIAHIMILTRSHKLPFPDILQCLFRMIEADYSNIMIFCPCCGAAESDRQQKFFDIGWDIVLKGLLGILSVAAAIKNIDKPNIRIWLELPESASCRCLWVVATVFSMIISPLCPMASASIAGFSAAASLSK